MITLTSNVTYLFLEPLPPEVPKQVRLPRLFHHVNAMGCHHDNAQKNQPKFVETFMYGWIDPSSKLKDSTIFRSYKTAIRPPAGQQITNQYIRSAGEAHRIV